MIQAKKTAPEAPFFDYKLRLLNRVADRVEYVDRLGRFHDQRVRDAIVYFEDHDRAGRLVGQAHFATANAIADFLAGLKHGQYITNAKPVARTTVQHDDLVLANLRDTADDRNDTTINLRGRSFREEVERYVASLRYQAVSLERLLFRICQPDSRRITSATQRAFTDKYALVADDIAVIGINELVTNVDNAVERARRC